MHEPSCIAEVQQHEDAEDNAEGLDEGANIVLKGVAHFDQFSLENSENATEQNLCIGHD